MILNIRFLTVHIFFLKLVLIMLTILLLKVLCLNGKVLQQIQKKIGTSVSDCEKTIFSCQFESECSQVLSASFNTSNTEFLSASQERGENDVSTPVVELCPRIDCNNFSLQESPGPLLPMCEEVLVSNASGNNLLSSTDDVLVVNADSPTNVVEDVVHDDVVVVVVNTTFTEKKLMQLLILNCGSPNCLINCVQSLLLLHLLLLNV